MKIQRRILKNLGAILILISIFAPSKLDLPVKSRESSGIIQEVEINYKEKKCIREALYYEARGESLEGMQAVLSVIKNRKNAKGFPNTFCGVIHSPKQFSYRNHLQPGEAMKIKPSKPLDHQAYGLVSTLAEEALNGSFNPTLEPSVLYYSKVKVKRPWMKKMKVVKIVDQHKFLKEV